MNVYCAVTTAPRPGGSLLRPTIASLKASGFDSIEVFAEPDSDLSGVYEPVRQCPEPYGVWRNFLWAVRMGLDSQADIIAVAQDDIETAKGLRGYLESIGGGWYSPYTATYLEEHLSPGWTPIPVTQFHRGHGACFLACTRETADRFIRRQPRNTGRTNLDGAIAKWCRNTGMPLMHHLPSLVQHVGATSTIHHGTELCWMRSASTFDAHHIVTNHAQRDSVELETLTQHPRDCEESGGVGAD